MGDNGRVWMAVKCKEEIELSPNSRLVEAIGSSSDVRWKHVGNYLGKSGSDYWYFEFHDYECSDVARAHKVLQREKLTAKICYGSDGGWSSAAFFKEGTEHNLLDRDNDNAVIPLPEQIQEEYQSFACGLNIDKFLLREKRCEEAGCWVDWDPTE